MQCLMDVAFTGTARETKERSPTEQCLYRTTAPFIHQMDAPLIFFVLVS